MLEAAAEAGRRATAAGGLGLDLVQVDEVTAFLVLRFPDLETERRITEEIGGPLMRERVRPYLAGGTDRRSGEVVISAPY